MGSPMLWDGRRALQEVDGEGCGFYRPGGVGTKGCVWGVMASSGA